MLITTKIALRSEPRPPPFTYAARAYSEVRKRPLLWRMTSRNGSIALVYECRESATCRRSPSPSKLPGSRHPLAGRRAQTHPKYERGDRARLGRSLSPRSSGRSSRPRTTRRSQRTCSTCAGTTSTRSPRNHQSASDRLLSEFLRKFEGARFNVHYPCRRLQRWSVHTGRCRHLLP